MADLMFPGTSPNKVQFWNQGLRTSKTFPLFILVFTDCDWSTTCAILTFRRLQI